MSDQKPVLTKAITTRVKTLHRSLFARLPARRQGCPGRVRPAGPANGPNGRTRQESAGGAARVAGDRMGRRSRAPINPNCGIRRGRTENERVGKRYDAPAGIL